MEQGIEREKLGSRLGFLLLSAGCAIGLGNVWRFPFITGAYGGAAFVLIYLVFLVILGLPIMVMEFSVGRAAKQGIGLAFRKLEPKGTFWHLYGYGGIIGCYVLMMFYTTVTGWMLSYCWYMGSGQLSSLTPEQIGAFFGGTLGDPFDQVGWMTVTVVAGFLVCSMGLQRGVERITKIMMGCLLVVMLFLVIRSVTLPGAEKGILFYLKPDFGKMFQHGIWEPIYAAMGQAFFTLSLGIGAMAIFGSYIGKGRALLGEAVNVAILDTFVAFTAGLIIFPACFAFGVAPDSGPNLIFVTLPNIFNSMPGGQIWGTLFFIFLSFAALTTIIAVFENIISFAMDLTGCSRGKAVAVNLVVIILLSLPCVFGFNLLSGFQPLGAGSTILDLEDFIVSNNLLPLGSLVYLLFCTSRYGWGWKNFRKEANAGTGIKFPKWSRIYVSYILPLIVLFIFVQGYWSKFFG